MKQTLLMIVCALCIVVFAVVIYMKNYHTTHTDFAESTGTDIIAFGDSLVYGYGATQGHDFISILSKKAGVPIINLGHTGDTTADGVARLGVLDQYHPKIVIVLLGGNDALRQVPIDTTFENLKAIIKNIQERHAKVLLLGVRGSVLQDPYQKKFSELSQKFNTNFVPDVLAGLFGNQQFMSDEVHPNDSGYAKIADKVYPELTSMLR